MHLKGGVASNFHGLVDSVHALADALCAIALTPALSSFSGRIKRRLEVKFHMRKQYEWGGGHREGRCSNTLCISNCFDLAQPYMWECAASCFQSNNTVRHDTTTKQSPYLHPFVGVLLGSLGVGDKAAA